MIELKINHIHRPATLENLEDFFYDLPCFQGRSFLTKYHAGGLSELILNQMLRDGFDTVGKVYELVKNYQRYLGRDFEPRYSIITIIAQANSFNAEEKIKERLSNASRTSS